MKRSRLLTSGAGLTLLAGLLAACGGGSALGGEADGSNDDTIKVGLLVAQSGVYAPVGSDMERGFKLYLEAHDNMLGGRKVDLVTVDEGDDPQAGVAGATRLAQQENVDVVVGVTTGPTAMGSRDIFDSAQVLTILGNSGSVQLGTDLKSDWVFRAALDNGDPGRALGAHLADDESAGDVFLMGADSSGGHETLDGFKETFPEDRIVGEVYTPFGTTSDFSPYLQKAKASGAHSVFVFYAGGEAIEFTKQADQFGLSDTVQLIGAGYTTVEGAGLAAQGQTALGVRNAASYNWDLDYPENKTFVEAYTKKYGDLPTQFSANMYDVAIMLDQAASAMKGDLSREALRDAFADLSGVSGVRGELEFDDNNTVKQAYHLLEVQKTEDGLHNVTIQPEIGHS